MEGENTSLCLRTAYQGTAVEYFSHGPDDSMTLHIQSSARYLLNRLKGR